MDWGSAGGRDMPVDYLGSGELGTGRLMFWDWLFFGLIIAGIVWGLWMLKREVDK